MSQEIKTIPVKDLVLWSENPRDPIDPTKKDQDIVDRAFEDNLSKWTLAKLVKEMGPDYDFSELPTVVYQRSKPIVYDGNRRIILAKLKHGYVTVPDSEKLTLPDIPKAIPCNVCSKDVALQHILRKHSASGSWAPLERDIFLNKYMKQPKSPFLVLEESTGLISSRPLLNQGFVRDEILTDEGLQQLGFVAREDQLLSKHNLTEAKTILSNLAEKIESKNITTRTNRRKALAVLEPQVRILIERNSRKKLRPTAMSLRPVPTKTAIRQSRRVAPVAAGLFAGVLYLKPGVVSNLYRDIADLYKYYIENRATLSATFPAIIRMSLRLLCETAAADRGMKMSVYIGANFDAAKAGLSQGDKTTLATHNVKKETIEQLLHTGSHNYQVASNFDQTLALSLILGAILTRTHGKPN